MNSTTDPKAIEPDDVVAARADERLVHAYDQIARADEQLARLNEQLSKLEKEPKQEPSAVVGHRPPRETQTGATRLHRLAIGRVYLCLRFRLAVLPRRCGQVDCRPVGAAAYGFVALDRKTGEFRAAGPIDRSTGRGDPRASAINTFSSRGPAGRRADSRPDSARTGAVAPYDGARSRKPGAGDRAAQGEPGTNGPRQCEGHRGTQGEPGANDAPYRQDLAEQISEQSLRPKTSATSGPPLPPIAAQKPVPVRQPPQARARPQAPTQLQPDDEQ